MIRLPNEKQRILVLGKTGTGKTCAAVWHLSNQDFSRKSWIVLNHKGDDLIDSIEGAEHVDLNFRPHPKKKGLFIYHPIPDVNDAEVTQLLWDIHALGNIGIYIDEGYMIPPRDPAMQALLTQGRSKKIPMIILSQRPTWISRFCISEADFIQVFYLTDQRDRKVIQGFIPVDLEKLMQAPINTQPLLKQYHSIYYDDGKNNAVIMSPVPTEDIVLNRFNLDQPKNVRSL